MSAVCSGARRALLAAVAALGACVLPADPVPTRLLQFEGRVLTGARAPVAGAEVRVWAVPPEEAQTSAPLASGHTGADGRFALETRVRNRVLPAGLTLRVVPPTGSGLAAKTASGPYSEVFTEFTPIEPDGGRYRTEVVLAPAP